MSDPRIAPSCRWKNAADFERRTQADTEADQDRPLFDSSAAIAPFANLPRRGTSSLWLGWLFAHPRILDGALGPSCSRDRHPRRRALDEASCGMVEKAWRAMVEETCRAAVESSQRPLGQPPEEKVS